jgi:hypothetical protein
MPLHGIDIWRISTLGTIYIVISIINKNTLKLLVVRYCFMGKLIND